MAERFDTISIRPFEYLVVTPQPPDNVQALIVNNGPTTHHDLKERSRNAGQLNQAAMIAGTNPFLDVPSVGVNAVGDFYLARIGDAVASRNIHAALYDALRVCKDI